MEEKEISVRGEMKYVFEQHEKLISDKDEQVGYLSGVVEKQKKII